MDGLGRVSDGLGRVSDGLGRVLDALGRVLDALGRVLDGLGRVLDRLLGHLPCSVGTAVTVGEMAPVGASLCQQRLPV